eukprot:9476894-Pyramimonas_sp.AAC.1
MQPVPTSTPSANCLRRGKPGHWARGCAEPPNQKRARADDCLMVDEVYWGDMCHGKASASAIPASNGVMDCGATTS